MHSAAGIWLAGLLLALQCRSWQCAAPVAPEHSVIAFYYLWYGEPETDGVWKHWNHEVLKHWNAEVAKQHPHGPGSNFQPPHNLHSPYYPARGPYSSSNRSIIREHIQELLDADVSVMAVSWWGPHWRKGTHDTQGVQTDRVLPLVLKEVEANARMKIALHLEPYPGRTLTTLAEDLQYFVNTHGQSPALLRFDGRPVYFCYDSYMLSATEWATLLDPASDSTIRGTPLDGFFIGLWLGPHDGDNHILPGHFDGFYTYFASEVVSYASNSANWESLARWASTHNKTFIASVGPGYDDSRVRPWNTAALRERQEGKRYAKWWQSAISAGAHAISITSYNEWGEGTQIEAAQPYIDPDSNHTYKDYGGQDASLLYMELTRTHVKTFKELMVGASQRPPHHPLQQGQEPHGDIGSPTAWIGASESKLRQPYTHAGGADEQASAVEPAQQEL